MNPRAPLDPRLLEALSVYLDGKLTGAELAALEEQLKRDEDLRTQLSELRAVRDSLRSLPTLKPPRPLTLSPAQAGAPLRRSGWFSSRRMTFASAMAALAFVVVASFDVFLRGSLMPQAARLAAPEAMPVSAPEQTVDSGGEGFNKAPTTAAGPTLMAPQATANATSETARGGGTVEPTIILSPTPQVIQDECDANPGANKAVDRCGLTNSFSATPVSEPFSLPDFRTLAPFLEWSLGLLAVILAVLAFVLRRRR
jgi:hypothetical protein